MSRILSFDFKTEISFSSPVSGHAFLLRCIPADCPGQKLLSFELSTEPFADYRVQRDSFGNLMQIGRIEQSHESFGYRIRGRVERSSEHEAESAMACYRYPSPYTAASEQMRELIEKAKLSTDKRALAESIMHLTHEKMHYTPGSTGLKTTAVEAFASGKGVCQDYAHVFLALARCAGQTVRYCNGLREGLSASHAWCEVYIDGVWYGIDPTEAKWTDESYIRFGTGRDYADCPLERGVFSGCAAQDQKISISCIAE